MEVLSALLLEAAEELWLRFSDESDMTESDRWERVVLDELEERSWGLRPKSAK